MAAPGRPSDCPANANLCNDELYRDLMRQQCPRMCGFCDLQTQVVLFRIKTSNDSNLFSLWIRFENGFSNNQKLEIMNLTRNGAQF